MGGNPGCLRCGAMLGTAVKVSDLPANYEMVYESGKDEGGDFLRCLKCSARNYYSADADGPTLLRFKDPPSVPVLPVRVGKIGEGALNVAFAIVTVGLLFGLFTTPVLAGITIFSRSPSW